MGVNGLLRFLKKCSRHVNISDFKGYTVAVDAYCWIHRASFSCAMDLALGNPTDQYIKYCLKLLNVILAAGVRPILVFDGADLPAKSETNAKRHSSKRTYREKAAQFLLEGNRKAAQECFEKCIEVTPEMARAVIKAVRDQGVDCIVSPYESDAQLAYLVQAGYADLVVTEDSDLLMFGCKQIIFKLDLTGSGVLVTWSAGIGEQCCGIPSKDFSHASLRCMGVLSGCDYFPGIPRIGLATAAKILRQCRLSDFRHLLSNLGQYFNLPDNACLPPSSYKAGCSSSNSTMTNNDLPPLSCSASLSKSISSSGGAVGGRIKCSSKLHEETIRAALRAERTFRLQVVFDPKSRRRLRLTEPTIDDIKEERIALLDADLPDDQLFSYAGDDSIDASLSCAIALANVDFYTGEQVDTFDPEHFKVRHLFTAPKLPQGAFEESSNVNRIQACSPIKSILKKVHRPDGERLNKSIWNKDYKLEPVWLHYTSGAGSQPRPFCISLEDSKTDQLENGFCQNHETGMVKPVDPLPAAAPSKAQLRLVAGEVVHRNHRVFAPSVLTGEPAVLRRDLTRNGKCEESSAEEDVRIKDVLASYESGSGQYSLTSPLRMFEASETPVTSAGDYFASPVSTTIPGGCCAGTEDHQKSPIFHPKRQRRTLYAEPSLPISTTVDLTHPETDPAFLQRSSSCNSGTKRKTSSKTVRAFSLMQFSFTKRKKEPATGMPPSLTPEQRHHVRGESVLSARKENIQPRSPVYGNQTPVPAENVFGAKTKCQTGSNSNNARARPHISPLFLKWQFSSSKENSL